MRKVYAVAFVMSICFAIAADRLNQRTLALIVALCFSVTGYIIVLATGEPHADYGGELLLIFLVCVTLIPIVGLFLTGIGEQDALLTPFTL